MRRTALIAALGTAIVATSATVAARSPSPKDAQEYIIWPKDGAVIHGGFWLRMGLRGMGVAPKGVDRANTGHHHLIIDADLPTALDEQIASDRNHLHFGAGETEVRLNLAPGKHTLQLMLGDLNHVPHDPPIYSDKITITVK